MEDRWDICDKHILVLSSSGKPIFSKHGDEQELVTNFGLLQAVYSIVKGSGDTLRCISAGKRKIVYFVRDALYFVSISSTGEPDAILYKQLEFTYFQILLILTSKVHRVLDNNSSKDLRYLLGSDSTKLMKTTNRDDMVAKTISFESLQALPMHSIVRYKIFTQLKYYMEKSNAAACVLLCGEKLIMHLPNPSSGLLLDSSDFILLSTLVCTSSSLRAHEQNWVPICLPSFNADAYLQAYVAHFPISGIGISTTYLSLVLVSGTSDPESFRVLHSARCLFEEEIRRSGTSVEIGHSMSEENFRLSKYRHSFLAVNYFFKWNSTQSMETSTPYVLVPAQYISSDWGGTCSHEEKSIIYTEYYRNAVRMRCGTAVPEYFYGRNVETCINMKDMVHSRGFEGCAQRWRQYETDISLNVSFKTMNRCIFSVVCSDSVCGNNCGRLPNILQLPPLSNHSLVYVCISDYTVIGLASGDSELHVCFSSVIEPLHACNLANSLFLSLKTDSDDLFQTTKHHY